MCSVYSPSPRGEVSENEGLTGHPHTPDALPTHGGRPWWRGAVAAARGRFSPRAPPPFSAPFSAPSAARLSCALPTHNPRTAFSVSGGGRAGLLLLRPYWAAVAALRPHNKPALPMSRAVVVAGVWAATAAQIAGTTARYNVGSAVGARQAAELRRLTAHSLAFLCSVGVGRVCCCCVRIGRQLPPYGRTTNPPSLCRGLLLLPAIWAAVAAQTPAQHPALLSGHYAAVVGYAPRPPRLRPNNR